MIQAARIERSNEEKFEEDQAEPFPVEEATLSDDVLEAGSPEKVSGRIFSSSPWIQ